MIAALVVLYVIVCLFLIGVVLLQQGKSADLAGAFGGQGSQTAFGPRGAANLLTRLTTWSAILFMLMAITLTVLMARGGQHRSVLSGASTANSGAAAAKKTATPVPAKPATPAQPTTSTTPAQPAAPASK